MEISLEASVEGYAAHLLSEGYDHAEIAQLVHQTPVLSVPRIQLLQTRVGD